MRLVLVEGTVKVSAMLEAETYRSSLSCVPARSGESVV